LDFKTFSDFWNQEFSVIFGQVFDPLGSQPDALTLLGPRGFVDPCEFHQETAEYAKKSDGSAAAPIS
jgi:hypothetical protein